MSNGHHFNATFDPTKCTFSTCDYKLTSDWQYIPNLGENAALLAIFTISFTAFAVMGIYFRTWGYMIALCLGTLTEMIGYIGRIMAHNNVWDHNAWLQQYICLSIAPAFLTAGIYLTLSRIVIILGPELSFLRPNSYQYIFCVCDFVSLCLQGLGGGLAATANTKAGVDAGSHIMLAGIAFQVFSMVVFIILAGLFWRNCANNKALLDEDIVKSRVIHSRKFKLFIFGLAAAIFFIMIRNTYRLVELAQGWHGKLIGEQAYFTAFEGFMVGVAVLLLNVFHPGVCFPDGYGRHSTITRKTVKAKEAI